MTRDFAGWAQAGIAALIATVGVTVFAATTSSSVNETRVEVQKLAEQQRSDHDKVTTVDSKLDDLKSDVAEIKQDVKTLITPKH